MTDRATLEALLARVTGSVWSESLDGSKLFYVDAATPARALMAACLKARMEAQGE